MYKLVRLNFGRSPTHFGETGIGLEETSERVRSDTLFSAWVSTYARLFGSAGIEALLAQFLEGQVPPFRLSSSFVYRRSPKGATEPFIDYLPKPMVRPEGYPTESEREVAIAKTAKKIHYLPLSIWQRWYQGDGFNPEDAHALVDYGNNPDTKSGELGSTGTFDYSKAFVPYTLPKVSIDRSTHATNFYHTGLTQFAWEPGEDAAEANTTEKDGVHSLAGLYFLVQFSAAGAVLENELRAALELLGEEGIGGERSSGAGRFEVIAWEDISSQCNEQWHSVLSFEQASYHSLMSLYWNKEIPTALLGEKTRYTLQERGGWIASPFSGRQLRRQKVHMFTEGSVFTAQPEGELANVTPREFRTETPDVYNPHPIYRSGVALSLPIKLA